MKITKKQLKQLIETFIGRKGGAPYNIKPDRMYLRNPESEDLTPSKEDLMQQLKIYREKALNHPKFEEPQYQALKPKLEMLFQDTSDKGLASPFMIASGFGVLSDEEHKEVKKIVNDIKFLRKAKEIKGPEFGAGRYKSDPGSTVGPSYASYKAQRDDPGFEARLEKRVKEIVGDPLTFYLEAYNNNAVDVHQGKDQAVNGIAMYVIKKLAKKYPIYRHAQRAVSLPGGTKRGLEADYFEPEDTYKIVKRILSDNFKMDQIADQQHGLMEEYAEYLDLTDLAYTIDSMLLDVHEDTHVDDFVNKVKDRGYDEQFFEDSFTSQEGKMLLPQFKPQEYNRIMKYFIEDRITRSGDDVFLDGDIIYRDY